MSVAQPAHAELNTLSRVEAQRLTERIRVRLDRVSTAWVELGEAITEAYERRADLALGYDSWVEYAKAELRPAGGLAVEVRRQLVGMLSEAGMSTRAIAPTVGVQYSAVAKDIRKAGVSIGHTSPTPDSPNPHSVEVIDPETGEVLDEQPGAAPAKIVGLDGKSYARPAPKPAEPVKRRRRPITDQAHDAAIELTSAIDKVARIFADDRFTANQKQVAELTRAHLLRTSDLCQQLAEQLPN